MRSPFARLGYTIALAVFIVDQLVKYWIVHIVELQQHGWVEVAPFLTLTWVANVGVSMGLLPASGDAMRWLLVAGTGAIAALVAVWIARERQRGDVIALGLVLGGAAGNIIDRIRLGYVVDFVHVAYGWFDFKYVFNVADAAISVGVVLLLLRALLGAKAARPEELS
jgi:signal peptidase II